MKKLESRFCGIKNFRTDFREILSEATNNFTQISRISQMFFANTNHEKGEVASLYAELKFQTEFRSTTTTTTKLPRATG